jgi:hypothetical protein
MGMLHMPWLYHDELAHSYSTVALTIWSRQTTPLLLRDQPTVEQRPKYQQHATCLQAIQASLLDGLHSFLALLDLVLPALLALLICCCSALCSASCCQLPPFPRRLAYALHSCTIEGLGALTPKRVSLVKYDQQLLQALLAAGCCLPLLILPLCHMLDVPAEADAT